MEVHTHAHPPAAGHSKKWTHYLWEFLMLFLAVFCGFLAENLREHYVEGIREKKYMQNLLQDLARDTANLNATIGYRADREKEASLLVSLLYSPDRDRHLPEIYFYARQLPRMNVIFFPATAAMNQLKSAGAIRLVKKSSVTDSILAYDIATEAFARRQNAEMDYRNAYREMVGTVFDASVLMSMIDTSVQNMDQIIIPPQTVKPLMTKDQQVINNLCARVHFIYSSLRITRYNSINLKAQAIRLMSLLKKEYHLE